MEQPGLFDPQVLLHQRSRQRIQELGSTVMGAFISSGLPGVPMRSSQHRMTSARPGKTSSTSASLKESSMPRSRQRLVAMPTGPRLPSSDRQQEPVISRQRILTDSGTSTLPTRLMAVCIGPRQMRLRTRRCNGAVCNRLADQVSPAILLTSSM